MKLIVMLVNGRPEKAENPIFSLSITWKVCRIWKPSFGVLGRMFLS
jgi:hypothetical protein